MSTPHSLVCLICDELILPPLIATPKTAAEAAAEANHPTVRFGEPLDSAHDAAARHLAERHPDSLQHILLAATMQTLYLATANFQPTAEWSAWDQAQEQMGAALTLIFNSADAAPDPNWNPLQKGTSGRPSAS